VSRGDRKGRFAARGAYFAKHSNGSERGTSGTGSGRHTYGERYIYDRGGINRERLLQDLMVS